MTLCILIAPSGFKESLGPSDVADHIETGLLKCSPDVRILKAPVADGGEGFTKTLIDATGGRMCATEVMGPTGKPVAAHYGFTGGRSGMNTAVLEMAAAAGLRLVPAADRNPLKTSTRGVGGLIKAALDDGAKRILIGCGDSGTNDGGIGMAQALGIRLLDKNGRELGCGGGELSRLHDIDMADRDPRIGSVTIDVACNWKNILCGPESVAKVFGPQKGSDPAITEQLDIGLERLAEIIDVKLGKDVRYIPGGGASGGLGAGLHAFLDADLHPWVDIVMDYLHVDELMKAADLVITAEGAIDFQTRSGKIPAEIARRAKKYQLPVVVLAGTIGKDAQVNYEIGIDAMSGILEKPCGLPEAIKNTPELLINAAERLMRMILAIRKIPHR
ncbi:MAG: glycerate kinase [Desulfobacteraceae bacterium]|nr:glycerate kinase [Desulfobacteraceae bacterium]